MAGAALTPAPRTAPPTVDTGDVQGLVVRGYGGLPHATYVLASIADASAAGRVLGRWAGEVATAARTGREAGTALNVALTASGLVALGLPPDVVAGGFSDAFAEGMVTEHRSRILGDVGPADPHHWAWGGPGTPTVHVLVLVLAATPERLDARLAALRDEVAGAFQVIAELPTDPLSPTEAFGFVDGLSQPRPAGLGGTARGTTLPTGEFLLGYRNGYGQFTERPLLEPDTDPGRLLPRDPESGAADLGRNGTYLVLRQLRQDVDGFHAFLRERCPDEADRDRLAAKMVGRWKSGAPLVLAPDHDDPELAREDFSYHAADPDGLRCPLGAHIRRANPRDSLEPHPGTDRSVEITDRHRLLRRGRGYTRDDGERGLYFLCLVANLARQYEFVQHTWLGSPVFNGLQGQPDPLVAPRGPDGATFVEQARPIRRRHPDLPEFVRVRGGAYFFLPGVSALRYLATVPA